MSKSEEEQDGDYLAGRRRAHLEHFETALRGLGREGPEWTEKRWVMEREATIILLRQICGELGDNDWPDDFHLVDIIEKHLMPYL